MSTRLDATTVKKLAHLARLSENLTDEAIEIYISQIGAVLAYAEDLNEVDTIGISPLDGIRTISLEELRSDEPNSDLKAYRRVVQNIIANFPNKQANLLLVPGIFEN